MTISVYNNHATVYLLMLTKIINCINDEYVNPGVIGIFTNPFYFARKGLYKAISNLSDNINGRTLDIGCGRKPYRHLFKFSEYIGLEIDTAENRSSKQADVYYDGNVIPFSDLEFDSIVINQVFEHVFNPCDFLREVNRVLKYEGKLLLTVPFVWDEHEQPFDYARYSSFGMCSLLEHAGFRIIAHEKSIQDIRVIFQLFNCYTYKIVNTRNPYLDFILRNILAAPVNIFGELLALITPRNADLYLDNVFLVKKVRMESN